MATVRIGDRDLEVKLATLGFLKRKLLPARKALLAANEEETPDRIVAIIYCYVGHNEGITEEWLLDNVPVDPSSIMRACIVASGQQPREAAAGEAVSP